MRRTAVVLGVLLAALLGAAPAHASAGYRYWSFWEREHSTWSYATKGPGVSRPEDGAVQGFRYAVSEDSAQAPKPRNPASFAAVCARTPAKAGAKRVALVIDFGTARDAADGATPPKPRTACARVPGDATTSDALAAVLKPLRYDNTGILCAIAGYPKSGCAEQISGSGDAAKDDGPKDTGERGSGAQDSGAQDTGAQDTGDGGPSAGLLGGIAAVAALAVAAGWQARRRRR